jgi:uncharacterized SAM-binding protein YcdF (DUF218 family)
MCRSKRVSIRSKKILIGFVILGFLLLILFHKPLLLSIGDFLIIEDDLHPTAVIHVIAGEDYRTEYAIQLYKQGYGETLFFTGGWCTFHNYYHGQHAHELSLAQGDPLDAIAFDDSTVTSTYSEAERLKEWISHRPTSIRSVIVVSDPFHMRRARWAYKRVLGGDIEVQMAPVPINKTPYQEKWWEDTQSNRYVKEEYQKFIYYVAKYQLSWGPIKDWLVSLDKE